MRTVRGYAIKTRDGQTVLSVKASTEASVLQVIDGFYEVIVEPDFVKDKERKTVSFFLVEEDK